MKDVIRTIVLLSLLILSNSCEDFIQVDAPRTELIKGNVFAEDATANAAVIDIYFDLARQRFASGDRNSISFITSISSDEQNNHNTTALPLEVAEFKQFADNALAPNNTIVGFFWSEPYRTIFKCNATLEGLDGSESLTTTLRSQLTGEALFIRAFCYFHLVNLFGDVPLVLTTDYKANSDIPRSAVASIYDAIKADLVKAQSLLVDAYSFSNNERVRVNKGAATAMLARVYLFTGDWANAEIEATKVIDNTVQYRLATNVTDVFRTNGTEPILQFWRNSVPLERNTFIPPSTGPRYGALRPQFVSSFETGDRRATSWIGRITVAGTTYYYNNKYSAQGTPPLDYTTVLRTAEQFLIRAEARARQSKIPESQFDLNRIRNRAGLGNTTAADQTSLLAAVATERHREFFTEWGHRWFDLKRTGMVNQVIAGVKPAWTPTAALYPIPEVQLLNDAAMKGQQNPGY